MDAVDFAALLLLAGVLLIANITMWRWLRKPREERRWPRSRWFLGLTIAGAAVVLPLIYVLRESVAGLALIAVALLLAQIAHMRSTDPPRQ